MNKLSIFSAFFGGVFAIGFLRSIAFASGIVSLSPATTEWVYYLGKEKSLKGVTTFCDFPASALQKERVGNYSKANLEAILKISPQVILAAQGNLESDLSYLEKKGFKVFRFKADNHDSFLESISQLGLLLNAKEKTQQWLNDTKILEQNIRGLKPSMTKNGTLETSSVVVLQLNPIVVAGRKSLLGDTFEKLGIFYKTTQSSPFLSSFPNLSQETFATLNATHYWTPNSLSPDQKEKVKIHAQKSSAKVVSFDDDIFFRPSPRYLNMLQFTLEQLSNSK